MMHDMAIASMEISIRPNAKRVRVELDAAQFERLAADLGLFSRKFLTSIERAEQEIRRGKARRLRSLRDLRRA